MKSKDWIKIQNYLHKMEIVETSKFDDGTIKIKGHPKLAAVREALNWLANNYTITPKLMTKLEAWYRRNFCETSDWYKPDVIGKEVADLTFHKIKYIYVGKGKIWIKKY